MGATIGPVNIDRFAADLRKLWDKFNSMDPAAMAAASSGGAAIGSKGEC
jgi:hypothetical protein